MDTIDFDSDNSHSFNDGDFDELIEIDGIVYWSPSADDIDYTICKIPEDYVEIIEAISEQEWQEACANMMDQEEARLLELVSLITPPIYPTFKLIYARLAEAEILSDDQINAINDLSTLLASACKRNNVEVSEIIEAYQFACASGLL